MSMSFLGTFGVGLALLLALFLTGMPVFLAFFAMIILGVSMTMGAAGFSMVVNSIYDTGTSLTLGTVPLFILLGEILFRSGAVNDLTNSLDTMIGRIRGRHYLLSIALGTVLGALAGSATAVGAMMGRSLLPVMLERKYDLKLSIGTIMGVACLGPIIPPSILAIIVATLANVSVAALLIAGVIPGLLIAVLFAAYCMFRVWMNPSLAPEIQEPKKVTRLDVLKAVADLLPFSFTLFMVIGLMLLGIATASEAAAMGVLGSLVTAAIYRRLSWNMIYVALVESAILSAIIMIIVAPD